MAGKTAGSGRWKSAFMLLTGDDPETFLVAEVRRSSRSHRERYERERLAAGNAVFHKISLLKMLHDHGMHGVISRTGDDVSFFHTVMMTT
jgi:hypothetical protein